MRCSEWRVQQYTLFGTIFDRQVLNAFFHRNDKDFRGFRVRVSFRFSRIASLMRDSLSIYLLIDKLSDRLSVSHFFN